jgi:hypothetical protein
MRRLLVKSGVLVLALIGLTYLVVWHNRRPDVPFERLLADNPTFPTQWIAGTASIAGINWQLSERFTVADSSLLGTSNARRKWLDHSRKDTYFTVDQLMGNYRSPVLAWALDILLPLEQAHREEWGNLLSDEYVVNRYPSTWSYKSSAADRELVVCAEGTPNRCDIWLYRARYGQYILLVEFDTRPIGSNADAFAQIVALIDGHISRQLVR